MSSHLHSITKYTGVAVNLTQARIILEEDLQLRKGPHQIACWQVYKAFSCLLIDVGGPGLLREVPLLGRWLHKKADWARQEEQVLSSILLRPLLQFLVWNPALNSLDGGLLVIKWEKVFPWQVVFAHSVYYSSRNLTGTQNMAFHKVSFLQWWFFR